MFRSACASAKSDQTFGVILQNCSMLNRIHLDVDVMTVKTGRGRLSLD